MKRKEIFTMLIGWLVSLAGFAQKDAYLKNLTDGVLQVRQSKALSKVLNQMVIDWSSSGCPKITLMDDINRDTENEYCGKEVNTFKMNQLVTYVYSRQNTKLVSKGDYFNSKEKEVYYSAIEKSVKPKSTVTYTLTGHEGVQEFVFVAFNPNTNFEVQFNPYPTEIKEEKSGVLYVKLPKVKNEEKIVFSITNKSSFPESFVILNHNPQK